jgi:hypothetical protein
MNTEQGGPSVRRYLYFLTLLIKFVMWKSTAKDDRRIKTLYQPSIDAAYRANIHMTEF